MSFAPRTISLIHSPSCTTHSDTQYTIYDRICVRMRELDKETEIEREKRIKNARVRLKHYRFDVVVGQISLILRNGYTYKSEKTEKIAI